ncbi:hypothetical protein RJ55_03002 [Drechmeria coniospora]|nr:hypothetical protein RJ55_03002 [Drechmeria coniospora]
MPPSVSFADSPASPRAGIPLRKKSNSKAGRRSARPASIDPLSDRATQALIRRTLCPQRSADKGRDSQMPIDKLLPPLTSRNDVNLQLYAFLAIILREFVQSWYSKVTTDETFVGEILHIIAHCTQTLEERFRKLDLESLALNEIPELLEKHVTTYRTAHQSSVQPPLELDSREAYHALWPLPFLSPVPQPGDSLKAAEQRENEAIYRQLLVQAVLAVILPTAELENPCLTALVGQIFSELILGNAVGTKAVQPWLLYEGICILARLRDEKKVTSKQESTPVTGQTNLKISTRGRWSARGIFPAIVHLIFVFLSSIRLMAATIAMSTSLPPRTTPSEEIEDPNGPASTTADHVTATQSKVPVLASRAWTFLANLIELSSRMPWLAACFSLLQLGAVNGPGRIAASDSKLDR